MDDAGDGSTPPAGTWTILALDTGTSMLDKSMLTYTRGRRHASSRSRASCGCCRDPRRSSWTRASRRVDVRRSSSARTCSAAPTQEPANALRAAGVDPEDVELVILTHLHWDHAGNCDLFPDAEIVVQQSELRYAVSPGRFFRRSFLSPESGWGVAALRSSRTSRRSTGRSSSRPGLRVVPSPGTPRDRTPSSRTPSTGASASRATRSACTRTSSGTSPRTSTSTWTRPWTRSTGCARRPTTSCPATTTRSSATAS